MSDQARKDKALRAFRSGFGCAQSVISAYAGDLGLDPVQARAMAVGFGAGHGRLQKTCGALSGALMVIGLRRHDEADVPGSKEAIYAMRRELVARFEARHASTEWLKLTGVDFSTEDGLAEARKRNLFQTRCEKYVAGACEILEDLL